MGAIKEFFAAHFSRCNHYNAQDLFFLKIPDDLQEPIRLADKLYSNGFKKQSRFVKDSFLYKYEEPVKLHFWENPNHPLYTVKVLVYRSRKNIYVPLVYIRDEVTQKEYDPVSVPPNHRIKVMKATDIVVDRFVKAGIFEIEKSDKIIDFLNKKMYKGENNE